MRAVLIVAVWLVVGGGLLGGWSCDSRSHLNPFDPENPATHGTPTLVEAIAGDGEVELRWDPLGIEDAAGYLLWRWTDAGDTTRVGGEEPLAPEVQALCDSPLTNGVTYGYRLDLLVQGEELPARGLGEEATPGPHRIWVADAGSPPLAFLSADARRTRLRVGDEGPFADLVVNQTDGSVWTCDEWSGRLWHYDAAGNILGERDDLRPISHLALDEERLRLWALSRTTRQIYLLDENGELLADEITLAEGGSLRDLDVDPTDGTAWVADAGGVIRHVGEPGELAGRDTGGASPYAVAVDPLGRGLWFTDPTNRLVNYYERSESAPIQRVFADVGVPRDIVARAWAAGSPAQAWVADGTGAMLLVHAESGVLRRVPDIVSPRGLWPVADGSCWLVEGGTAAVVRVTPEGEITRRTPVLYSPRQLALWWREDLLP